MRRLSVVIASKVGSPFIDQCLRSIEGEGKRLGAEAIVVAAGSDRYAARLAADFPWARVIHAPDLRRVPGLRRRGVDEATGELVAIVEEHCSAAPDWLQQALAAHDSGEYGAVGGAISAYDYARLRDWVVYFCEYHGSLPPALAGDTDHLNDANIAYRRSVLLAHRPLLDDGYWPMTLHPTLGGLRPARGGGDGVRRAGAGESARQSARGGRRCRALLRSREPVGHRRLRPALSRRRRPAPAPRRDRPRARRFTWERAAELAEASFRRCYEDAGTRLARS